MDKGTVTKHFEAIIYLTPEETHKHLIKNLWWKLPWWMTIPVVSQISVVKSAKDEAGNGAIRQVPLGLHEEVLKAELGKYIEYHVSRRLWFPVTHHRGRIEFHAAGPNCTRMTWDINYTPKAHAFLILPGNWFMLELMIQDMVASANKGKNAKGSWLWFFVKLALFAYLCFMVNRAMNLPSRPLHPGREYLAHTDRVREDTRLLNSVLAKHTYLIIGGSGFTGSALVDDLRKRGAKKIKVMGRSFPPAVEYPYGPTKQDRYPLPGVEYVKGDVTDTKALKDAMKGVDVVFHMAVYYGNPTFGVLRGKEQSEKINVNGMKNIYNAAKESKSVSQIIYTSSVDTVFTHKPLEYVNETHPYAAYGDFTSTVAEGKWAIGDNYARTKIEAERYLLSMDNKDGIRTLSLRPDGIMGPGENIAFKRAVDIASILGILPFHFGPEIKHDITCVYNLVYAHVLATVKLATDPNVAGGKAYFITDDEITSLATYDVFKPAIEAAAGPVKLWFWVPPSIMPPIGYAQEVFDHFMTEKFGISIPPFLGYKEAMKVVMTHYFDNARARKDLGYQPVVTTGQCKLYIAEEIARRYGAVKE